MTVRTLLRLGKSSLVVVLPKDWLKENNLKSGDKIIIKQDNDGSLKLIPLDAFNNDTSDRRTFYINLDKFEDSEFLQRLIVANYLIGNSELVIATKKDAIHPVYLKSIREITEKIKNLEIIERKANLITLKSTSEITKISIETLIERLLSIVLSMTDHLKLALLKKDPKHLDRIIERENDVDRLHWLGIRQLVMVLKNRTLAKNLGITSIMQVVENRIIIKSLEVCGDYLEEIAKDLKKIDLSEFTQYSDVINAIVNLIENIEDVISDTNRAYIGLDAILANNLIKKVNELDEIIHRYEEEILQEVIDAKISSILTKLLTRLSDMVRNIAVICEIIINRAVEHPSKMLKPYIQEV